MNDMTMQYVGTATYDPADNKLRITPYARLPRDIYDRVHSAGYKWAPKQELFVAPMWTPSRYDLAVELCGEVGDEDTSLVQRAEERADRFEEYSEKRADEAARARDYVSSIADGIPFGQPILVGHHSEHHARRDAEKIENGMRKAVKLWETSTYWQSRAAGALGNAKYKELPAVRHRRIKGLEADRRKQVKNRDESQRWLDLWNKDGLTLAQAQAIANYCHLTVTHHDADGTYKQFGWSAYDVLRPDEERYKACPAKTVQECVDAANIAYPASIARANRWIEHYDLRIMYERAMLAEAGGLVADTAEMEVGGKVLRRYGEWFVITRINKIDGIVNSVSVVGHFASVIPVDEIKDYKAPTAADTAAVKAATKQPPLCNYDGEGFARMTQAEYAAVYTDHKRGMTIRATDTTAAHRVRSVAGFIGIRHGATGRVNSWASCKVFITDAKVKPAPALDTAATPAAPVQWVSEEPTAPRPEYVAPVPTAAEIETAALRESLKGGIQVVTVPQLFPTPPALAAHMVEMLDATTGCTVLEPSAGTGNILQALIDTGDTLIVSAVEINLNLYKALVERFPDSQVIHGDFLECAHNIIGTFDRIIMNPPFENANDITHIKHALTMLAPGGRLVAICANGPRQNEQLKPLASSWEVLPSGTFAGTGVTAALMVIDHE